jgi:CH-like domain in sperm protein
MELQSVEPKLNQLELQELLKWLDSFELSRTRRKLSRDFSDGVLLAEILKLEFPTLVNLHNYARCSSIT